MYGTSAASPDWMSPNRLARWVGSAVAACASIFVSIDALWYQFEGRAAARGPVEEREDVVIRVEVVGEPSQEEDVEIARSPRGLVVRPLPEVQIHRDHAGRFPRPLQGLGDEDLRVAVVARGIPELDDELVRGAEAGLRQQTLSGGQVRRGTIRRLEGVLMTEHPLWDQAVQRCDRSRIGARGDVRAVRGVCEGLSE